MSVDQGDEAPFPAMSPADVEELTDEQQDKQGALKQEGNDASEDGKQDVALEKLTEAIAIGCASALMYSRRGQLLMQLDRPRAAINDCTAALAVNPDSAKAFKIRAKAYVKLEKLEEAHSDFSSALKIDYDEQTYEDSLDVAAKVKELQAAAVSSRNKAEEEEYHRKLQESKIAYEAGLKARAGEYEEAAAKEAEAKRKAEEERKERVRQREQADGGGGDADEPGVPKAKGPPAEPTAEDVD